MGVDYREQYRPDELEPFWPNEIIKMSVSILGTLAVVMLLVVVPFLLEELGILAIHGEEPANPRETPAHIRPEWYFLAVYQYLKLMPQELLGISGKTLGIFSQGLVVALLVFLPFIYRRGAHRRPGFIYRSVVTLAIAGFLVTTLIPIWPPPPFLCVILACLIVIFYAFLFSETRSIRKHLHSREGGSSP